MVKTTVVHFKIDPFDVYIGRPSKWGNPFSHKEGTLAQFKMESVEASISAYREWILKKPELLKDLPELKGKRLACWCKTKKNPNAPCHGDVLAELADALDNKEIKND